MRGGSCAKFQVLRNYAFHPLLDAFHRQRVSDRHFGDGGDAVLGLHREMLDEGVDPPVPFEVQAKSGRRAAVIGSSNSTS